MKVNKINRYSETGFLAKAQFLGSPNYLFNLHKAGALSLTLLTYATSRDVWQVYGCPVANIHSRDVVCKSRETAIYTEEFILSFPISFINVTTAGASTRSIARINRDNLYACALSFIFDKASQLEERPTRKGSSLRLSNRYPITDAAQFLDDDPAVGVFSLSYDFFADIVVGPSGETPFFAGKFSQTATAGMGTFFLKFCSKLTVAISHFLDRLSLMSSLVTVNRDISNAHIDAQKIVNIVYGWLVNIASGKQVKVAINQAKVRFTALINKHSAVIVATNKRDFLSACYRPDGNNTFIHLPGQNTQVIGDGAEQLKRALSFLVEFVRVAYLRDTTHNQLRGQVKRRLDFIVGKLVDLELPKGLGIPRQITNPITSGVSGFQCSLQACGLCVGRNKFYLSS
jgi:hypothetical protein